MKIEIEKRQEKMECGAKKCYNITSLDLFSSIFVLNLYSSLTQSLWLTYKVWDAKQKAVAAIYRGFKESYVELPRFLARLKDASLSTKYKLLVDKITNGEPVLSSPYFGRFVHLLLGSSTVGL